MKMSELFTKTTKTVPADETAKTARLLIQAGFIHKEMAGVYAYLPLGLRVLENIKTIVREEMDAIGGQEVMMTALQPKELWERTNRWDDAVVDNWFKTKLKNGAELGVGLSHEEPLVNALSGYVQSYKDLPLLVYQIQTKFRNELRAQAGLLRGREFIMKDMYSFARSQAEHDELYEKVAAAYIRVYKRLGIGGVTFRTAADGGYFTERYSDEFQTISSIGEDMIFKTVAGTYYNKEVAPAKVSKPNIHEVAEDYQEVRGEGVIGVEALIKHLNISIEKSTKTLIFATDAGRVVVVAVRSDYDINE
ncbi:MAG: proline--tRNA ligase, partial [Candidatus Micrarchaeaceae archaeon]